MLETWIHRPQTVWLRKAVFQVHLWSAVSLGLYIFLISVTGSVLVYRNELYVAAAPEPIISEHSGPLLSDAELVAAAERAHPGHGVARIARPRNPDQAVEIWFDQGAARTRRLFDPRSGEDLGAPVETGIWLVSKLIELHDDLLAGETGRKVNGIGALAVLLVASTGLVLWWPGIKRWRRGLTLRRGVGWKRFVWDLHSMMGFWTAGFTVVLALSGAYLCFPQAFHALADWLQPPSRDNTGTRFVDDFLYWLAYLHFGRINGIGLPCNGPGLCDQATKALWAVFGLAPAAMFVTGTMMWWNRVLRPRWRRMAASSGTGSKGGPGE